MSRIKSVFMLAALLLAIVLPVLVMCSCQDPAPEGQALGLLRSAEPGMCAEGCECVCPSTTGAVSTTSGGLSSSGVQPDLGSTDSSSGASAETFYDAVAASGGVFLGDYIHNGTLAGAWVGIGDRRYRVRFPQAWDPQNPTPTRVLFVFHSRGAQGAENRMYDSQHYLSNGGYMVVLPEGEEVTQANGSIRYQYTVTPGHPDMVFIEQTILQVESWAFVDATHRRLEGWSNGGFAASAAGCYFGADVVVAGSGGINELGAATTCTGGPATVFLHHGTADTAVVPQYGVESRDAWLTAGTCLPGTPDTPPLDWCAAMPFGPPCECTRYDCVEDNVVWWCLDSGGHDGGARSATERDLGELLFAEHAP